MAIRRKLIAAISLLLSIVLSGSALASSLNLRPGVTETSQQAYDLHMMVIWIMTVIAFIVFGAMFYSIIKHRKSKNPVPATFSHSTKMEIFWTAIPALILIGLAVPAVKLLIKMEDSSEADLSIQVKGYQWKWKYTYPDQGIEFFSLLRTSQDEIKGRKEKSDNYLLEVDNELVIPAGKKVRFLVTAEDVIHSWFVPDLAVKKDAIPGFVNETWTKTDKVGVYRGQCAELCGKDHGFMPIVVRVVSPEDFDKWVQQKQEEKAAAERAAAEAAAKSWTMEALMERGKAAYEKNCALCHMANGEGVPGSFPALKGSAIATGPVEAHMNIVVHGKAGTAMQAFGAQLSDADIAAIITYERNAWGNNTGDKVQPADIKAFKAGN